MDRRSLLATVFGGETRQGARKALWGYIFISPWLIGLLVFVYMVIVKPDGVLTVTYERRKAHAAEKTCPRCAEQIKAAALVCHYCGHEFVAKKLTGS